jgi:hypothetical protein
MADVEEDALLPGGEDRGLIFPSITSPLIPP